MASRCVRAPSWRAGAHGVCVATLDEALSIRAAGIGGPVLVLYPVPAAAAEAAAGWGCELTVSTAEDAAALAGLEDVGRGRPWHRAARPRRDRDRADPDGHRARRRRLRSCPPGTRRPRVVVATWSHLASPEDPMTSAAQESRLARRVAAAHDAGPPGRCQPPCGVRRAAHRSRSGRIDGPARVRSRTVCHPPGPVTCSRACALRCVSRRTRCVSLDVPAGTAVGYGGTWTAPRRSRHRHPARRLRRRLRRAPSRVRRCWSAAAARRSWESSPWTP